jgi:hypothetical protein
VQVWVRNAGSSATYDAWEGAGPYVVTTAASVTVQIGALDAVVPANR